VLSRIDNDTEAIALLRGAIGMRCGMGEEDARWGSICAAHIVYHKSHFYQIFMAS
jgi:hypothetical protein